MQLRDVSCMGAASKQKLFKWTRRCGEADSIGNMFLTTATIERSDLQARFETLLARGGSVLRAIATTALANSAEARMARLPSKPRKAETAICQLASPEKCHAKSVAEAVCTRAKINNHLLCSNTLRAKGHTAQFSSDASVYVLAEANLSLNPPTAKGIRRL